MKLLTILAFSLIFHVANASDLNRNNCNLMCTPTCDRWADDSKYVVDTHNDFCFRGIQPPKTAPECAQSCSRGCRAYVRGLKVEIVDYFQRCGGGDPHYGDLECVQKGKQRFIVVNSLTQKEIGEHYSASWRCEEAIQSLTDGVFCGKSSQGYQLYTKAHGKELGDAVPFEDRCHDMLDGIKDRSRMCVKNGTGYYKVSILDGSRLSRKRFSFLDQCLREL